MSNSYLLYQKYEKRGNQPFHPSYPVEYSVDGNGTMQKVIKMENDPNCDSISPTRYQWVVVTGDYMCSGTTKCQKEKEQRSDDFGMTWRDTGNYRAGAVIEYNSVDCGYIPPQYRTVSGTPYCNGYTKMFDTFNQVSYDGGITWENTGVSGSTVIEYNSPDCGYPIYRWVDTDDYVCVGYDKHKKMKEQVSTDNGTTWSDTGAEDAGDLIKSNSVDCGYNEYTNQYFTTEATYVGNAKNRHFVFEIHSAITTSDLTSISYSMDSGATWTTTQNVNNKTIYIETPNVDVGQKVLWKGTGVRLGNRFIDGASYDIGSHFWFMNGVGRYKAYGNIMSLLYGDSFRDKTDLSNNTWAFNKLFMHQYNRNTVEEIENIVLPATTLGTGCYTNMFNRLSLITAIPELPATTLANNCYEGLFYGCTSLTTPPELISNTLADSCYMYMFSGCTSLTTAPELPVPTLANNCYTGMFMGCTSLTTAPVLPATTLANGCYADMFAGCTSLTTPPELPVTTLASQCYYDMFSGCTSLTTAPELPATTLAEYCYGGMFQECTSLTTAPELPATTLASHCYNDMFGGCTGLTTAPSVLPATTLVPYCYESMFVQCTSLTTAPDILARNGTGVTYAISQMFRNCFSLNYIKCMLEGTINPRYFSWYWVQNVSSSGTFVKAANATWETGDDGIPTNWTVQNA